MEKKGKGKAGSSADAQIHCGGKDISDIASYQKRSKKEYGERWRWWRDLR